MIKGNEKEKPTCFVIMPISDGHEYEPGHFARVYEHLLKPAISQAGYRPIRADDTTKTDYIVVSLIQRIVESEMVLCDFSSKNPNVMYELGLRHAFNKPVTLVKDRRTEKVFDIQGLRFYEYEHSLRIDTVQKDIEKIATSLTETAAAGQEGVNSVIQLAGIKPAELPDSRTVSGDTQLVLSAIAALERRFEDVPAKATTVFFRIEEDKVVFTDNFDANLGDDIYGPGGKEIGKLIDIHPSEQKIFVRQKDGKVIPFSASSVRSRGLTTLPF